MRFLSVLLAFAAVACFGQAPATGTWEHYLQRLRAENNGVHPYILVLPSLPKTAQPEADLIKFVADNNRLARLVLGGDLSPDPLPEDVWADWRAAQDGRTDTRWILMKRSGQVLIKGSGNPDIEKILEVLKKEGFVATWEQRRAFLREQPENGEAWTRELVFSLQLANLRFKAWTGRDPSSHELRNDPGTLGDLRNALGDRALFPEVLEALKHLANIPGWEGEIGYALSLGRILEGDIRIQKLAEGLEAEAWDHLQSLDPDPLRDSMFDWYRWIHLALLAEKDLAGRISGFRDAPESSLRLEAVVPLRLVLRQRDPVLLARLLETILEAPVDEPVGEGRSIIRSRRATGQLVLAETCLRGGRPVDAETAIESARRIAGSGWPNLKDLWEGLLKHAPRMEAPARIRAIVDAPPLPDLPAPMPPPTLQLVALDPALLKPLRGLLAELPMAPWSAKEIAVGALPAARTESVQKQAEQLAAARWALLRGQEPLLWGTELPPAKVLCSKIEAIAPSRLQLLSQFIARNPDHLGARKSRFHELLSRMPDTRLERQLAEDALACLLPPVPRNTAWKPDVALWQWAAGKALPEVERLLLAWPSRQELWSRWFAWAELHGTPPDPLSLLWRVKVWAWRGPQLPSLPFDVQGTVAAEFRRRGRFSEMRDWFKNSWESQDRTSWQDFLAKKWDAGANQWEMKQRRVIRQAIVDPLREALVALRRDSDVVALDREVVAWLGEDRTP